MADDKIGFFYLKLPLFDPHLTYDVYFPLLAVTNVFLCSIFRASWINLSRNTSSTLLRVYLGVRLLCAFLGHMKGKRFLIT
jgi:hypothetical protein